MILFWVYHRYWVHPSVFQSPPGLLHSRESQAKPLLAPGILAGRSNMQISMLPSLSSPSSQLSHEKKKKKRDPLLSIFSSWLFVHRDPYFEHVWKNSPHKLDRISSPKLAGKAAGTPGRGRRFRLGFRRKMGTFGWRLKKVPSCPVPFDHHKMTSQSTRGPAKSI